MIHKKRGSKNKFGRLSWDKAKSCSMLVASSKRLIIAFVFNMLVMEIIYSRKKVFIIFYINMRTDNTVAVIDN